MVPPTQEAQSPPPSRFSEDHSPWPLTFYPVLCRSPSDDGGDYQEQPLPIWNNDIGRIYPRTDSCGIQSTSEPSIPDSVNTFLEEQQEKTLTPGTREDAAEEPFTVAMHHRSCSRAPRRGDDALDTETCGGSPSNECQRLAIRDWRCRLGTRSGPILHCLLPFLCLSRNKISFQLLLMILLKFSFYML